MKKIFTIIISALLITCIYFSVSGTDNYVLATLSTDNYTFVEKDMKTGATNILSFNEDDLIGFQDTPTIQSVIGNDDRVEVGDTTDWPYSAIAFIRVKWPASTEVTRGTAWMVSKNVAVTAAHTIYNEERGGFAKSVEVYPGRDGYWLWDMPYGKTEALTTYVSQVYINEQSTSCDWGLISLEDDIGLETGIIQFRAPTDEELYNLPVEISGYPSTTNSTGLLDSYKQFTSTGVINSFSTYNIFYSIDTSGGQSGAPVLDENHIAIGIHTNGENSQGNNFGVKIVEGWCNAFNEIIALNE